jgi:hypothetical protein
MRLSRGFVHGKLLCKQLKLQAWCIHGVVLSAFTVHTIWSVVRHAAVALSLWLCVFLDSIALP